MFTFGKLVLSAICLSGFASFAWTTWAHFSDTGERPPGMRAIFVITPIGVVATLLTHIFSSATGSPELALSIYGLSLGLFWWAVNVTRERRLSIVFSSDSPKVLIASGPYAWIRHPFYASYLLFWLAGPIATGEPWLLLFFVVLAGLYWRAAKAEERKFSRSSLAGDYAAYAGQTRMFVPWIL